MDTAEQQITPEEKLFRVIAAANRHDGEIETLLEKYAENAAHAKPKGWIQKTAAGWEHFFSALDETLRQSWDELIQRPVLLRGILFMIFIFGMIVAFASRKSEKNFYFYSDRQAYEKFLPAEAAEKTKAGETSSIVVPAKEETPFHLVGISWDEQGLVAMIEVSSEERAKFIRKGDELPGGVKVVEIKENSVTLASGSRQWQIS